MCDAVSPIIELCKLIFKCVVPPLKKHVLDFAKNAEDFKTKKEYLVAVRRTYEEELERAIRNLQKPTFQVKSWSQKYEQIRSNCDLVEQELPDNENRSRCSRKRFKFSQKLVEKTKEMNDYTTHFEHFHSSLFVADYFAEFKYKKKFLESQRKNYDGRLSKAIGNRQEPTEELESWINDYGKIKTKCDNLENILADYIEAEGESNHHQELLVMTKQMNDHIDKYKQFDISEMFVDQLPPTVEKQSTDYIPDLQSVEKSKEAVYAAIKEFSVIGLWDMGGVGKTTLMKHINNEMDGKGTDFKHVIMVTVSSNPNIKNIQDMIGGRLQLNWNYSMDTNSKAKRILEYLKKNGSTLIIFDDVWETLDLKAIGITDADDERDCYGKIVLTTRNLSVCKKMLAKAIKMEELHETESWKLFKINASINDNGDPEIIEQAKEVCKECAGLPLAISVVAKALKGEDEPSIWRQNLKFLKEGDPEKVPNFLKKVYYPLKLSYDSLPEDDILKRGFLVCSLFPEDHQITLSDLISYGIGAGTIDYNCQGKETIDAYRNIFIHLKRRGLLQDVVEKEGDQKENSARMHDVVRDLAIYIARKEFEGFFNQAGLKEWISSMKNYNAQLTNVEGMKFISLNGIEKLQSIHSYFFDSMENVLLLKLRGTSKKKLTTTSNIRKLKNLRALIFKNIAVNVKDLFFLQNLSFLCLQNVHISELNEEFSTKFVHLRMIDFSDTKVDIIRPKAFSSLQNKLEVLNMSGSFNKWNAFYQKESDYVAFVELMALKNLYSLHIDIGDERIFSHKYTPDFVFPSVEYFSIRSINNNGYRPIEHTSNDLKLPDIQLNNAAKWVQSLFEKTKSLSICGGYYPEPNSNDGAQVVDAVFEQDCVKVMCNFKCLVLDNLPKYKNVLQYCSSKTKDDHNLATISIPIQAYRSFQSLKEIYIFCCNGLRFIFPWNVAVCLMQLEKLSIHICSQLEVIIGKDENDYKDEGVCGFQAQVLFLKLKTMDLYELPNLESLWQQQSKKRLEMEWSSLQKLFVTDCKKLERLFLGEKSAPMLDELYCSKEWYDQLHWEDEKAASRFDSIWKKTNNL